MSTSTQAEYDLLTVVVEVSYAIPASSVCLNIGENDTRAHDFPASSN